ncbi:WD repeat-containing protein jip5 [Macrophomina phaseolina MS6]|uniref:WD repeat-containing protein jip5 n=2 Tax=Macrophomina phaseolina TaxID=35725 RepID=K2SX64_MACPH|nr:WD repeat-containing protein jip5 [Macrophomina phaseolina MS6]
MKLLPEGVGPPKTVAVGLGNGLVRFVRIGQNRVVGEISHDETGESVVGLGFDVGGRLITGGGQVLKVWCEKIYGADGRDDDEEEEDAVDGAKRPLDSDDDESGADDSDADSSDEEGRKRRKKRKRGKGKDKSGGKPVVQKFKGLD